MQGRCIRRKYLGYAPRYETVLLDIGRNPGANLADQPVHYLHPQLSAQEANFRQGDLVARQFDRDQFGLHQLLSANLRKE